MASISVSNNWSRGKKLKNIAYMYSVWLLKLFWCKQFCSKMFISSYLNSCISSRDRWDNRKKKSPDSNDWRKCHHSTVFNYCAHIAWLIDNVLAETKKKTVFQQELKENKTSWKSCIDMQSSQTAGGGGPRMKEVVFCFLSSLWDFLLWGESASTSCVTLAP